jgi:hypothetical protein
MGFAGFGGHMITDSMPTWLVYLDLKQTPETRKFYRELANADATLDERATVLKQFIEFGNPLRFSKGLWLALINDALSNVDWEALIVEEVCSASEKAHT